MLWQMVHRLAQAETSWEDPGLQASLLPPRAGADTRDGRACGAGLVDQMLEGLAGVNLVVGPLLCKPSITLCIIIRVQLETQSLT